jgi:sortase A
VARSLARKTPRGRPRRCQTAVVSRAGRVLSVTLITAGVVVLLDVGLTLAYREPISAIYGSILQGRAADELEDLEARFPGRADLRAIATVANPRRKARILARRFARRVGEGDAIGRVKAPAMDGLDAVLVQGTDTETLQKGPGHYPQTGFPGEPGTVAIAGHRTTYLAPFRHIDSVERGDRIRLEMPYATFAYRVERTATVEPEDIGVIRDHGYQRLVLSACHPLYSAAERYIVFARLRTVRILG